MDRNEFLEDYLNVFLIWKNKDSNKQYYLIYKKGLDDYEEGLGMIIHKQNNGDLNFESINRDSVLVYRLDCLMDNDTQIEKCLDCDMLYSYIEYYREGYDSQDAYSDLESALKRYERM